MSQSDYQIAKHLQEQFELEDSIERPTNGLCYTKSTSKDKEKSLVDPSWEVIDPTPNIYGLFVAFDKKFFWSTLQAVSLEWSKKMSACAGMCSYDRHAGMCRISLSEPLLRLRPRKDLVETLLHEMIHAYLFVTENNRERDGHGPTFISHMSRINNEAGTNITIYHDFHDEVKHYLKHWWRCNGPCGKSPPYFGMVRRAINRAPGPNDRWWNDHFNRCGGTFIKIKEPESKKKKSTPATPVQPTNTIFTYFPTINNTIQSSNIPTSSGKVGTSNVVGISTTTQTNSNGSNIVSINDFKDKTGKTTHTISTGTNNVVGINSIKSKTATCANLSGTFVTVRPVQGINSIKNKTATCANLNGTFVTVRPVQGINSIQNKTATCANLNGTIVTVRPVQIDKVNIPKSTHVPVPVKAIVEYTNNNANEQVRNHWINKFPATSTASNKRVSPFSDISRDLPDKRPKPYNKDRVQCPVCQKELYPDHINFHLDQCLKESSENDGNSTKPSDDSTTQVVCLVCNTQVLKTHLNEHLDECMGEDVFIISDDTKSVTDNKTDETDEDYNCPVCSKAICIGKMSEHLNTCLNANIFEEDF